MFNVVISLTYTLSLGDCHLCHRHCLTSDFTLPNFSSSNVFYHTRRGRNSRELVYDVRKMTINFAYEFLSHNCGFRLLFCGRIGKPRCEKLYTVAPLTNLKTIFNFYLVVQIKCGLTNHNEGRVERSRSLYSPFPASREIQFHRQARPCHWYIRRK